MAHRVASEVGDGFRNHFGYMMTLTCTTRRGSVSGRGGPPHRPVGEGGERADPRHDPRVTLHVLCKLATGKWTTSSTRTEITYVALQLTAYSARGRGTDRARQASQSTRSLAGTHA